MKKQIVTCDRCGAELVDRGKGPEGGIVSLVGRTGDRSKNAQEADVCPTCLEQMLEAWHARKP